MKWTEQNMIGIKWTEQKCKKKQLNRLQRLEKPKTCFSKVYLGMEVDE